MTQFGNAPADLFRGHEELKRKFAEVLGEPFVFRPEPQDIWNQVPMVGKKYVPSVPDPSDITAIIPFTFNRSVSQELRLNKRECLELKEFLDDRKRSLATALAGKRDRKGSGNVERDAIIAAARTKVLERIEVVLDPLQQERLQQVVYHIEIERVGVLEAISKGYLSKRVNPTQEQQKAIQVCADAIKDREEMAIRKLRSDALVEFLGLLEPLQRSEAKTCLGESFAFKDELNERDRRGAE